jgi:hypothetical protein
MQRLRPWSPRSTATCSWHSFLNGRYCGGISLGNTHGDPLLNLGQQPPHPVRPHLHTTRKQPTFLQAQNMLGRVRHDFAEFGLIYQP